MMRIKCLLIRERILFRLFAIRIGVSLGREIYALWRDHGASIRVALLEGVRHGLRFTFQRALWGARSKA